MNFDVFRPDSSPPPDIPDPSVAIAEGRRRRSRRRALGGATASLALVVLAAAILSPGETRRPVVADDSTAASACRLEDLSVSHEGVGLATGHWGDRLLFQNVGRRACVLEGYPTVTGLADHESRGGVGAIQTLSGYIGGQRTSTEQVELVRGAVAAAVVEGSTVPEPGEVCETFGAFAVYLPGAIPAGSQKGATSLLRLLGSWEHCGEIQVHPFAPHTVSGSDCPTLEDDLPVTTIRSQPGTAGDGVNDRFEAPGDATPALSAQEARTVLPDNALSRPVDAVLARWTNLNGDGPSRLVWILRNMYTAQSSRGPTTGPVLCGEAAYLIDAMDGSVLKQRSGTAALTATTAPVRTSTSVAPSTTPTSMPQAVTPSTTTTTMYVTHTGTANLTFSGVLDGPLVNAVAQCTPRPDRSSELQVNGTLNGSPWVLFVQSYTGEQGAYGVITGVAGGGTGMQGSGYAAEGEYPAPVPGVTQLDWARGATIDVDTVSREGQSPAGELNVRGTITCNEHAADGSLQRS